MCNLFPNTLTPFSEVSNCYCSVYVWTRTQDEKRTDFSHSFSLCVKNLTMDLVCKVASFIGLSNVTMLYDSKPCPMCSQHFYAMALPLCNKAVHSSKRYSNAHIQTFLVHSIQFTPILAQSKAARNRWQLVQMVYSDGNQPTKAVDPLFCCLSKLSWSSADSHCVNPWWSHRPGELQIDVYKERLRVPAWKSSALIGKHRHKNENRFKPTS